MLLLCAGIILLGLHTILITTPYLNELYHLNNESGYPEVYQYLKWLWITILLIYVSKQRKSFSYFAWVLVFVYFLLTDAMEIHNIVGAYIAGTFDSMHVSIGELIVSVTAGIALLSALTWAYVKGARTFRKMSHDMMLLIFVLVFFGIGVDTGQYLVDMGWKMKLVTGVIEEGGEMLVASLILWYVFLLSVHRENTAPYIYDCIRIAITRMRRS